MKIAVASNGTEIWPHFGHCVNFNIYEAQNGEILTQESLQNPGHRPGFLPNYLADRDVNVVNAGEMGESAAKIFSQRNIEVITGAQGDAKAAAEAYLQGRLKSTGAVCHEHQHEDTCKE